MAMARRDSIMWFMMGIAQLLIGNALLADEGTSDWIAYMIQGTGGGTMALGLLLTKCSQPLEHPEDRDYDRDRVPSGFHGLGGVVHDFLPPSRRVGR